MDPATHLASNIRQLRERRGASQQQVAQLAGIPRATWANLESGSANPTLAVMLKAAAALGVSLQELVAPPRATGRLYKAEELDVRRRGGVTVRKLLPEALPGVEAERMALPAGTHLIGVPHTAGTREYLTCESGVVELTASGTTWRLEPGDVVVFRGDQRHSYRNPERGAAVAYSVVALAGEPE